jgi:hypothetical protein
MYQNHAAHAGVSQLLKMHLFKADLVAGVSQQYLIPPLQGCLLNRFRNFYEKLIGKVGNQQSYYPPTVRTLLLRGTPNTCAQARMIDQQASLDQGGHCPPYRWSGDRKLLGETSLGQQERAWAQRSVGQHPFKFGGDNPVFCGSRRSSWSPHPQILQQ